MTKFRSICLVSRGAAYAQCDIPPMDVEVAKHCSREFRPRLLSHASSFRAPLPDHGCSVLWRRTGHTAGFALWFNGAEIAAVTLLLTGLDAAEDDRAILTAQAIESLPFPDEAFEQVRATARPIHALLHCDSRSATDAALSTASATLAATFFSLLGTSAE